MNQSKKTGDRLLLRPSEGAQWEVWAMDGAQPRLIETRPAPAGARLTPQTVLGLPLRQLFAVPLWLATTDPSLMRGMIFLQLERRGLSGGRSAGDMVFDYRVVATVSNKTLVLVATLPHALPAELCLDLRAYEPTARLLPLPEDQFALWREDGRLVLAATRGRALAYFQALGEGSFSPAVLQELQCIKLQLESTAAIVQMSSVTLWGDFTPADIAAVAGALDLRVITAPRPAPVLPGDPMDLIPSSVRRLQSAAQSRARTLLLASAVAGAYLIFLLCLVGNVAWLSMQATHMQADIDAHQDEVASIKSTAARWNAMTPAVDPDSYPVELLLRCSNPLPPEGVRFTQFNTGDGTISIRGEAANATVASRFAVDLKQSNSLRDYQFEMPLPTVLPSGNTQFLIEGVRYGAHAHQ